METCKKCNKKTKNMYHMNAGLFCEKHWQIALAQQDFDLRMDAFGDRMKAYRKSWGRHEAVGRP